MRSCLKQRINKVARSTGARPFSTVPPARPQEPITHEGKSEPVFPSMTNFLDRTAEVFFMTEIWYVIVLVLVFHRSSNTPLILNAPITTTTTMMMMMMMILITTLRKFYYMQASCVANR